MMGFSPSGGELSRPFFVAMAGSWGIVASITSASDVNNIFPFVGFTSARPI